MRIGVWSDISRPWCYVGKRRLERALDGGRRGLPADRVEEVLGSREFAG
ncbi:MAG TPA: hypothetical protein VKA36_03405 [Solirubrobacterales bacterium]|nr:hypothetical protein [Solirubrobacterales bacterium]